MYHLLTVLCRSDHCAAVALDDEAAGDDEAHGASPVRGAPSPTCAAQPDRTQPICLVASRRLGSHLSHRSLLSTLFWAVRTTVLLHALDDEAAGDDEAHGASPVRGAPSPTCAAQPDRTQPICLVASRRLGSHLSHRSLLSTLFWAVRTTVLPLPSTTTYDEHTTTRGEVCYTVSV